jgi:hypothetical protein
MNDILTRLAALTTKNEYGLLPCPFCADKGQPVLWRIGNEHTKERGCDVGCAECGFIKHVRVIRYSCDWAEERAKEAWNSRPREAAFISLVQEAVGEIESLNKKISTLEWAIGCKDKQILQFSDAINDQGTKIERLRKVLGQIASSHHVGNAWAQGKAAKALNPAEAV